MPTYEYRCQDCSHQYEVFKKTITRRHPRKCPECNSKNFGTYLGTPIGRVKGEPKTFGQQAELNEKRLGKELMQKMREEDQARMKGGWTGPQIPGAKRVEKSKEIPFYRQGLEDPTKPLDITKVKDIPHYIETGEMK